MLTLHGHTNRVRGLAYSPDGTTLASCSTDMTVRLWDLATGTERLRVSGHRDNILGVVFSVDGRVFASQGSEPTVIFWDVRDGARRSSLGWLLSDPPEEPTLVGLLGDIPRSEATEADLRAADAIGWRLIRDPRRSIRVDPSLGEVFEVAKGTYPSTIVVPSSPRGVLCGTFVPGCGFSLESGDRHDLVGFSPDRLTLARMAGNEVHLWKPRERERKVLKGHTKPVRTLAFSPDGILATGGHDGSVRLWDVEEGDECARFDWRIGMIDSVAFAPDGMTIAAGGRLGIVVWDVDGWIR